MDLKSLFKTILEDCAKHSISVTPCGSVDTPYRYSIDGFSKSGEAILAVTDAGIICCTRYDREVKVESFQDLAKEAYFWNKGYCDREVYGWSKDWSPVFEKYGWDCPGLSKSVS